MNGISTGEVTNHVNGFSTVEETKHVKGLCTGGVTNHVKGFSHFYFQVDEVTTCEGI